MLNGLKVEEVAELMPNDLKELAQLLVEVVADGASIGFLPPVTQEEAIQYWTNVLSPDVILWVARLNGMIVGSIQLHLCTRQNGNHRAEIAKLMVHPQARRKGMGRILMQFAEEKAKSENRRLLVLDTRAGDPSNALYRSCGYVEAGRIPHYARSADGDLHETVFYYKQI
ncbi:Acetyltransferase (GNAT) family protein [Lihuaxuella thermophila]|uniref:Acetyltransferase (GNAT) family protein n=1 Tax=Lihuaxuella thermophila TaxID=1173111 RepID=A0A1H8HJM3_9BACL|nr:Acetyltransferase (GNAT) family protein [Lihuaxuella thermophila]